MADKGIPNWPKVTIRLYDDHNAEVKIAGRSHPVNHHDPRQAALQLVSERAAQLGRPVKATAVESDGASWPLVIHPDGRVEAVELDTRKGKKSVWPIFAAMGFAIVLLAGTLIYLKFGTGTPQVKPTVSPKLPELSAPKVVPDQFSARPVPLGYSVNASWTVDLMKDTNPAVSPDGTEVAVITPEQRIAVFDSAGKVLWQDEVPRNATGPYYTSVDAKPVVAVTAPEALIYWEGDGAEPKELDLPNTAKVNFFGTSPLVEMGREAGASLIQGGTLKAVPNQPRLSTVLLAEGDKALMARYQGPLYWSSPDKDLQTQQLASPRPAKGIDRVLAASPGRALVLWKTGQENQVIPAVHSTANGGVVAICPVVDRSIAEAWRWVPDRAGKVAAWGECLIDLTTKKTIFSNDFQPTSVTGTQIYGRVTSQQVMVTPGRRMYKLQPGTAQPWGIAGSHAIVVHDGVLYALDKKK